VQALRIKPAPHTGWPAPAVLDRTRPREPQQPFAAPLDVPQDVQKESVPCCCDFVKRAKARRQTRRHACVPYLESFRGFAKGFAGKPCQDLRGLSELPPKPEKGPVSAPFAPAGLVHHPLPEPHPGYGGYRQDGHAARKTRPRIGVPIRGHIVPNSVAITARYPWSRASRYQSLRPAPSSRRWRRG
jgi:hypothetical protein